MPAPIGKRKLRAADPDERPILSQQRPRGNHLFLHAVTISFYGSIHDNQYACSNTITPMIAASATLCQKTNRSSRPSCPC